MTGPEISNPKYEFLNSIFEKWIISVTNDWIRNVECVTDVLVQRSVEVESLWQIRIGQEETAKSNEISAVLRQSLVSVFPVVTPGSDETAAESLSHRHKALCGLKQAP